MVPSRTSGQNYTMNLSNYSCLQNYPKKISYIFFVPEIMSIFMCGAKPALLFSCAKQCMKALIMCGANLLLTFIEPLYFAPHIYGGMQTLLCT